MNSQGMDDVQCHGQTDDVLEREPRHLAALAGKIWYRLAPVTNGFGRDTCQGPDLILCELDDRNTRHACCLPRKTIYEYA